VPVRAVVVGVASIRLALAARIDVAVGVGALTRAVALPVRLTLDAVGLEAGPGLGADANAVADLDVLDVLADPDGLADDLMADAAGCEARC
jgi:hypothetical protein